MQKIEINFSLSIDSILNLVYAQSALRAYCAPPDDTTAFLTPDQRCGLRVLVLDAIAWLAASTKANADPAAFADQSVDIIELSYAVDPSRIEELTLATQRAMEASVAYRVLQLAFCDSPLAAREYARRAENSIENLCSLLSDPWHGNLRIDPHY